jgi:hypothetical protein
MVVAVEALGAAFFVEGAHEPLVYHDRPWHPLGAHSMVPLAGMRPGVRTCLKRRAWWPCQVETEENQGSEGSTGLTTIANLNTVVIRLTKRFGF